MDDANEIDYEPTADEIALGMSVVLEIGEYLSCLPGRIQGMILADLTAVWLSGHSPDMRNMMWDLQASTINKLADVYSAEVWQIPDGTLAN